MAKINYEKLKERECVYCGDTYKPSGPAQKACSVCQTYIKSLDRQVTLDMQRKEKFGTYCSIGQGRAQGIGENSPFWKGGRVLLPRIKQEIRDSVKFCEDCGKNLIDVKPWGWCIHHIDEDNTNQSRENLKLLCRRCHQLTHHCENNLPQNLKRKCNDYPEREYTQASGSGEQHTNADDIV